MSECPAEAPGVAVSLHGRKVYAQKYEAYVAVYGKQVRTIKWWVGKGREAPGGPDLPPLDQPLEMPGWWARVMSQGCPRSVLDAAQHAANAGKVVETAVAADLAETRPASRALGDLPAPAITSQDENLQMLKGQLAQAWTDVLEARTAEPPDARVVETKEKKWRELRNEVEAAEEAAFKMRKMQGKLVDLDAVEAALGPILATVADAVRSTYTRVRPFLAKASTDPEREEIWNRGIDEAFATLVANGFVKREQLTLAA